MDNLITDFLTWMYMYPSRAFVTELVFFIIYATLVFTAYMKRYEKPTKRFVFCDGRKSRILYVDMVTENVFRNYSKYVGYAVIDANSSSIYFNVPNGHYN